MQNLVKYFVEMTIYIYIYIYIVTHTNDKW